MDIENGVSKACEKLSSQRVDIEQGYDDLISRVRNLQADVQRAVDSGTDEVSSLQRVLLYQLVKEMNEWSNSSLKEHRESHGLISKLGKDIDKSFVLEFGSVIGEVHSLEDPESKRCVIQALHECFVQHGLLDIAEEIVKEAEMDACDLRHNVEGAVDCEGIAELNKVVDGLRNDHLIEPAIAWCQQHCKELEAHGSSVEFEIYRLAFMAELVKGSEKSGADALLWRKQMLTLARNLSPFATRFPAAVQTLMGCLAFAGSSHSLQSSASPAAVSTSPNSPAPVASTSYREILSFSQSNWHSVADLLHKTACQLMGLPKRSAVETAIAVGSRAVPPLFQIIQVVQRRQCQGFLRDMESELPIEIPLADDCVFHSIFACPILKQQTTPSNPPLRLACGHVISREVLQKLAVGNRIRCPYCPNIDQNPNDARPVFF